MVPPLGTAMTPHCPHSDPSNLCSTVILVDLPLLDILWKWNHLICDLLCLTSLIQHNVFKFYPCFSMNHSLL